MKQTKANQGGNYITPGQYLLLINAVLLKDSQKHPGCEVWIVEMSVIESVDKPDATVPAKGVGEEISWTTLSKYPSFLANIKAFIMGVMDIEDDDEVDEDATLVVCSEENPFAGMYVRADAFHIKTKEEKDFTVVNWTAVDPAEQEALDAATAA